MGINGAFCANTLNSNTRVISLAEWNILREGYLCMSPADYAKLKASIEQLCHNTNSCTYDIQQQIQNSFNKIDVIRGSRLQKSNKK